MASGSVAAGFQVAALRWDPVPRHLGEEDGETAPAGRSGHGEARPEEGRQQSKRAVDRQGENRADQREKPDDELDLAHEGKSRTGGTLEGQLRLFPCGDASFKHRQGFASCGPELCPGFFGPFATATNQQTEIRAGGFFPDHRRSS